MMRNNKIFQNKTATPKPKLNKVKSPLSIRKNFLFKRHSNGTTQKRIANNYRNHILPVRTAVRRLNQDKENVDVATQRGNIKVVVRVRPPNSRESGVAKRNVVSTIDANMVVFDPEDEGSEFFYHGVKQTGRNMLVKPKKNMKFAFDRVYGPEHENPEIFHETIEPIIDIVLGGFNCSVFAYGSTGAGKTYTMLGSETNPGMTFLTVMELYRRLESMKDEHETEIAVSYLEVYNEMVRDLLSTSGFLNIREDSKGGVAVPNLTLHKPQDAGQLMAMLSYGNSVRSQHPTDQNAESSRSHAVFQVIVTLRQKFVDLNSTFKTAKLVMVDLAGSERGSATGYRGQRFREGASINRSLLSLANCINALADGKQHIPYRDSKLTRILKDSLGGNCRTVMIANVSPSESSYDDTYNTLKYANRAKNIKCQVKKNVLSVNACVTQYAQVVEEMSQKIESLSGENQILKDKLTALESVQPANNKSEDSSGNTNLDALSLENYKALLSEKVKSEIALKTTTESNYLATIKLRMRQQRMETLTKLASLNPSCNKALGKQRDHIESDKNVLQESEDRACGMKVEFQTHLDELKKFKEGIDQSRTVNVPASEYFELLQGPSETKELENKSTSLLLDKYLKLESTLGKSMISLVKTHIMLRQKADHIPPSINNEYKEAIEELCGNRVHWSTLLERPNEISYSSIPTVESMITNTIDNPEQDDEIAGQSKANETFDCDATYSVL